MAFRHKFRHTYAFELDWEKKRIVARKLPSASEMLKKQINQFLEKINDIDH